MMVVAHNQGRARAIKRKPSFNSAAFLAKVGEGRSIGNSAETIEK